MSSATAKARATSRTWYLVRHGETEWNVASRLQGQLDSRLTPLGREHASAAARLLARLGTDAIFASPLGRVRETLAIVAEEISAPITFDDRLKEWSSGVWSGELHADLREKWPEEFAAWTADRYNYRPPGAETFVDLAARARDFLDDHPPAPGGRTAIVAHGFMNRALAHVLLSLPPVDTMRIRQPNDTVIRIVERNGARTADYFVNGEGPVAGLPEVSPKPLESA